MARGYDLTDEKETKKFLRDVEIEYQFQCRHEKEADGCHRLAEFLATVKNDAKTAANMYKDNCDNNNYPESCYKYGQYLLAGKGTPDKKVDYLSALRYNEKSCDLNCAKGCIVSGQLRELENVEQNTDKALAHYSKACSLRIGDACYILGTFYLTGKNVDKDLKKAYELTKAGCELNNMMACNNLSLMYQHGHGTDRNSYLADITKKRAMLLSVQESNKQKTLKMNE